MAEQNMFKGTPEQIAQKAESEVPENLKQAFVKVVAAGDAFMFNKKTHRHFLDTINQEGDLGENVGKAMGALLLMLYKQSNEQMPLEVAPQAGVVLIARGADFLEKVTGETITPDVMARAYETMIFFMGEKFNLPPETIMGIAQKSAQGGYQ